MCKKDCPVKSFLLFLVGREETLGRRGMSAGRGSWLGVWRGRGMKPGFSERGQSILSTQLLISYQLWWVVWQVDRKSANRAFCRFSENLQICKMRDNNLSGDTAASVCLPELQQMECLPQFVVVLRPINEHLLAEELEQSLRWRTLILWKNRK